jgi:hypothetical protein
MYNCFGFNKEPKGSIQLKRKKDPRLGGHATLRRVGGVCIKWYQSIIFFLVDNMQKRKRDKGDSLISSRGINVDLSIDFI